MNTWPLSISIIREELSHRTAPRQCFPPVGESQKLEHELASRHRMTPDGFEYESGHGW